MRTKAAWVVALAVIIGQAATAQPARAQAAYYWLELGRTAVTTWEDKSTQSFALVVVGEGIITNGGERHIGKVGCAHVENAERAAYGCGELSQLAIDDDLGTAAARGTFEAEVFDFKTERTWKQGTISLSGTWKASGVPRPRARGRYIVDGAFVHTAIEPAIARDASEGVQVRVRAGAVGQGPPQVVDAQIQVGASFGIVLVG